MAHRNYLIIAGIAAATALAACSTTVTGSAEDAAPSAAIRFAAAPTKAAVISGANMDAFAVWGWYRDDATTTPVPVFDATTVTRSSGQWTYDGTRYWLLGKTYNFTALHPADLPAGTTVKATADDGSITIKGFDATATGKDAVDLMLATAKDITHEDIDNIAPVGLKFEHLLARVNVLGAVMGGGQMHVKEITLSGIPKEGDYENRQWATRQSTGVISGGEMLLNLTTGTDIFGDLLMIPQSVGNFRVELSYWENDEEQNDENLKTASFALPTGEVTEWEAGKSYRYTFTKDVAGNIVFMKPVVTEWNTATGGIITVE